MSRASRKSRRIVRVITVAVILVCSASSVQAARSGVEWPELAEHLADISIPLQDVDVSDLPDNINDLEPDRTVAQIIENTFYLWQEYDIPSDDGPSGTCIVMLKPKTGPLSKAESRVLLTASTLWEGPPPAYENVEVLDPSAPELNVPPIERKVQDDPALQPERVVGSDDRMRVSDSTEFPWRTICYLWLDFPDGYGRGTGCLVSPHMVLTCGHSVYDQDTDSWVDDATIAAGQNQSHAGASVLRPYGTRKASEIRTNSAYVGGGGSEHDYGAILFENPFVEISTYMPVEFTATLSTDDVLYMAGYPADVQGETSSKAMWWASAPLVLFGDTLVDYTIDTSGGNSGSPVSRYSFSSGSARIIAVHVGSQTGGLYLNEGVRLGSHNQALITDWMQWTQPQPDDDYEENDTLATAYDLSTKEKTWLSSISGMGVQKDEDWFKINVTSGYERVLVDCRFTHASGDIDVSLLDFNSARVASSPSTTDDEYIDCVVPYSGTYYIKVYYGNAGNTYDLWWDDLRPITEVHRFWSESLGRHFFTASKSEKDKLINRYSAVWTYEGVAYDAYVNAAVPGLQPVYRFWSDRYNGHFYTISESEKNKLIGTYSYVWTFEDVAFYAFPEGSQPLGTSPVYRFWSDALGTHFYTISESEKTKLVTQYADVWSYEGIAWYAYK